MIEREAKLFEAGSYPDRGIEITEDDLDRIIESTREAPIRIEHSNTPFDGALGVLKSLYRRGKELFGTLCFTRAAWELMTAANARRLSVAIKKDKSAIAEISLVREPRIADAAVFGEDEPVHIGELSLPASLEQEIEPAAAPFSGSNAAEPDPELARLKNELVEKEVDRRIDELKRAGKITPASEVFARAILRSGEASAITFADAPTPVSEVFRWFLESQPKAIEFAELATSAGDDPNEPEIFAKLGVTSGQVERYRGR